MNLLNFAVSFLAVGGATYALFKLDKAPLWLIIVSFTTALSALITALPHLPHAIDAVEQVARRFAPTRPFITSQEGMSSCQDRSTPCIRGDGQ